MTPAQARAAMMSVVPAYMAGISILGIDGLPDDRVQLVIRTPIGSSAVEVPVPNPPPLTRHQAQALAADAESRILLALRPFEGDCGRGFNGRRGVLPVQTQYSADEGWV